MTAEVFILPLDITPEVVAIPEGYEAELYSTVPFAMSVGKVVSAFRCAYYTEGYVHKEQADRLRVWTMRAERPGTVKVTIQRARRHPPRRPEIETTTREAVRADQAMTAISTMHNEEWTQ